MKAGDHANQRAKELVARIQAEQDPKEFTALIEEFNHLLDGDRHPKRAVAGSPAPTDAGRTRA